MHSLKGRSAVTLVELLIILVILAILASVVIPGFADSSESTEEAALIANLYAMRGAVERYALEHDGKFPGALVAIARYTNKAGAMSSNKTAVYTLGKYIAQIPPCPTGPSKGGKGWAAANANPPTVTSGSANVGWLYHSATGGIFANDPNHLDK